MKYIKPKYPRVLVSPARHRKLSIEAKKKDLSIAELVEGKLKASK